VITVITILVFLLLCSIGGHLYQRSTIHELREDLARVRRERDEFARVWDNELIKNRVEGLARRKDDDQNKQ